MMWDIFQELNRPPFLPFFKSQGKALKLKSHLTHRGLKAWKKIVQ